MAAASAQFPYKMELGLSIVVAKTAKQNTIYCVV